MNQDATKQEITALTERLHQALDMLDRLEARWGPGVPCEDPSAFGDFLRAWFPDIYWRVYTFEWDARLRRDWLLSEIKAVTRRLEQLKARR